MAFNFGNLSSDAGDFIPIIKFDCRSGRMTRRDRIDGEYESEDITSGFKAIFDFENAEVGYINFDTGGAPDFHVVRHDERYPDQPSDKHRQGIRLLVKLGKDQGGDLRELASTAKAFLRGINDVHTAYEKGVAENPGKLPVVELAKTVAISSGEGARKSTNYSPVFKIAGWVSRPADLVYKPRSKSVQNGSSSSTPPSTGSTKVSAPSSDDDFG